MYCYASLFRSLIIHYKVFREGVRNWKVKLSFLLVSQVFLRKLFITLRERFSFLEWTIFSLLQVSWSLRKDWFFRVCVFSYSASDEQSYIISSRRLNVKSILRNDELNLKRLFSQCFDKEREKITTWVRKNKDERTNISSNYQA